MELIVSSAATGAENMRRDLELWELVRDGHKPVSLRLYSWQPWCVSLGKHQPLEAIDVEAAQHYGFDVVHRPTGGRAVLHADEVTYCICTPVQDSLQARSVYAEVHRLLFASLSALSANLAFASLDSDLRTHYSANGPMGQACFTSHARSEILWHGRKVVGSAQRVIDGVLLQHGSILCGPGHERLADVIRAEDRERDALRSSIDTSSATLTQAAARVVTVDEVIQAIVAHVKDTDPRILSHSDAQR